MAGVGVAPAAAADFHLDRAIYQAYAAGAFKAQHGDWAGAAVEYERAYHLRQNSPEILVRLAEALVKTGRDAEAEKFARRALDEDSGAADAFLVLAELALKREDPGAADRWLERRVKARPDDLESRLRLGFVRETMNDQEGVVRAFSGYPSLRPGAAAANFHLGVALVRLERYPEALAAFRAALRENPGYYEAARNIAIIADEMESDTQAVAAWGRTLELKPDDLESLRRRAVLFINLGRWTEAETTLVKLVEIDQERGEAMTRLLAQVAWRTGHLRLAARTLLKHAQRTSSETHYLEAVVLSAQAGTETATLLKALRGAYSIGRRPVVGMMLVRAYLATGRDTSALKLLEKLSAGEPPDSEALWSLALVHHKRGDETRAVATLLSLLEVAPRHAPALNYIGYTWAEAAVHLDRAEELVRRALAEDPENGEYIDSLGWIFFQRGEFAEARPHLERAHRLLPRDPTIMEHLGDAYARLGMSGEALDYYRRALNTGRADQPARLEEKIRGLE